MTGANPLDWTAEPFLTLYVCVTIVAIAVCLLVRALLIGKATASDTGELDLVELAYLSGGKPRAADTVVVGFLSAGAAALESGRLRFPMTPETTALPRALEPFRGRVIGVTTRQDFHKAIRAKLDAVHRGLARRGLTPSHTDLARLQNLTLALMALPIALGGAKILLGMSRHRPIGYLALLVLLTAIATFFLWSRLPSRTSAGSAALETSREHLSRAARAPLEPEMALAFALTGTAVLAGTPFADFARQIRASGGSDGGSGCGGGGGGGGGGCGGCSGD